MPQKKPFNSDKNIAISIQPKEKFAKGDVMRSKTTGRYSSRFRTIDIGDKGGLRIGFGKYSSEVANKSPGGAKTRVQRYLVEQKDFKIKNEKLVPKTNRGESELKSIKNRHGSLIYMGEEQFITQKNKKEFQELSYFNKNNKGGMIKANRPGKESLETLKKLNIPESTKLKIRTGKELTDVESEILHSTGFEFVRSSKRKSFLREYTGRTETRMQSLRLANKKRGL